MYTVSQKITQQRYVEGTFHVNWVLEYVKYVCKVCGREIIKRSEGRSRKTHQCDYSNMPNWSEFSLKRGEGTSMAALSLSQEIVCTMYNVQRLERFDKL